MTTEQELIEADIGTSIPDLENVTPLFQREYEGGVEHEVFYPGYSQDEEAQQVAFGARTAGERIFIARCEGNLVVRRTLPTQN